ncbi:MAG: YceI family protein [Gaiellaceae bacterium]
MFALASLLAQATHSSRRPNDNRHPCSHRRTDRHVGHRSQALHGWLRRQAHGYRHRAWRVHRLRGHARDRRRHLQSRGSRHRESRLRRHERGEPRRPPALARLLRRRHLPRDDVRLDEHRGDRRRTFAITGDLTLHGVTEEIVLHAEVAGTDVDPFGNERVGIEISGQLSRADYGMKFNQALGSGNMLVGDKVKLALDVSAIKQA